MNDDLCLSHRVSAILIVGKNPFSSNSEPYEPWSKFLIRWHQIRFLLEGYCTRLSTESLDLICRARATMPRMAVLDIIQIPSRGLGLDRHSSSPSEPCKTG